MSYVVGLTGGIGSGKSAAADEFARIKDSQLVGGRGKFVIRKNGEMPAELATMFEESERKRIAREAAEAAKAAAEAAESEA